MGEYIRARTPQQKQERINAILDATEALFEARPYHEITLSLIAEELGWSRANLYKYANTKEEIFLALYTRANQAYIDQLDAAFKEAELPMPHREFAQRWAAVAAEHHSYFRYQDILVGIIETNVTLQRLTEFKGEFYKQIEPVLNLLGRQCPGLAGQDRWGFYLMLLYQACALSIAYNMTPLCQQAMELAGIPTSGRSFNEQLSSFVEMCLSSTS